MPTVAITGAAGAIGSATARAFDDAGWSLVLIDYGASNAASLRDAYPTADVHDVDLTDRSATEAAFEAAGAIDAVLAIAGGFAMQAALDATADAYAHMLDLNFQTLFHTAQAAGPHLTGRSDAPLFMGVSAPAALNGQAQSALYAASKGAVAAYLKSLDKEWDDVRVSTLYPMGVVDTPANREAMPDGDPASWIATEELAASMVHLATRSPRGHLAELKVHAA
ncbi:SDR family oxidoreductase [Salisaeta longa]|uniref:SDR family oxidoreductase n=1 Tax=Salisaeta longa TaxID=503170 RepID=UPI0003B5E06E|nr:SDR family NAD(P)-dependent oxidoreductase [Salisaeta longa]